MTTNAFVEPKHGEILFVPTTKKTRMHEPRAAVSTRAYPENRDSVAGKRETRIKMIFM